MAAALIAFSITSNGTGSGENDLMVRLVLIVWKKEETRRNCSSAGGR